MTYQDGTLNIHGQWGPHDEVFIEGSPDALRSLAAAISRAADEGVSQYAIFFASDGEGYEVVVRDWISRDPDYPEYRQYKLSAEEREDP